MSAWLKHGEAAFVFSILERCEKSALFTREQFWIDQLKPDYNSMREVRVITAEMRAKMNAATRRRAELRTHCPHGHEYTPENSYYGRSGSNDKRCRRCNAERINRIYHNLTPEQLAERKTAADARRIKYKEREKAYRQRTRNEKRAYDLAYRPVKNARRRERAAASQRA